jgi:hypothetical protein
VENVREVDVLESRVVEVPHTWLSSTIDEPPKSIATNSQCDQGGEFPALPPLGRCART